MKMSDVIRALPSFAYLMLPGLAGASRVGAVAQRTLPLMMKGAAFDYPSLSSNFIYPFGGKGGTVTTVNGKRTTLPELNASLDRANLTAAEMQDIAEHNRAVRDGTEKSLERWWPGEDTKPRRTLNPSSSAVEGIRINKDGTVQVKWYNGSKWYTYKAGKDIRDSSSMAKELLGSPSIGRALVRNGKLAHKDSRDLTGNPVPDNNVGWWGRKYYNPNW